MAIEHGAFLVCADGAIQRNLRFSPIGPFALYLIGAVCIGDRFQSQQHSRASITGLGLSFCEICQEFRLAQQCLFLGLFSAEFFLVGFQPLKPCEYCDTCQHQRRCN